MTERQSAIDYRSAQPEDLDAIEQLIRPHVEARHLLPRSRDQLAELIGNGYTAFDGESLIGFAAVEIYSNKLAEILCLAVADGYQRLGIGKRLVELCIDLAKRQSVMELMAISSSERFWCDCGFDFSLPFEKKAFFYQIRKRQ